MNIYLILLLEISDPNMAVEKYLKGAQQLIEQAEEEIKKILNKLQRKYGVHVHLQ